MKANNNATEKKVKPSHSEKRVSFASDTKQPPGKELPQQSAFTGTVVERLTDPSMHPNSDNSQVRRYNYII